MTTAIEGILAWTDSLDPERRRHVIAWIGNPNDPPYGSLVSWRKGDRVWRPEVLASGGITDEFAAMYAECDGCESPIEFASALSMPIW
jgi:hypothetical protein